MKIHLLCNDGSPLGVTSKTVWGDNNRIGVGGAELALITMCEEWTKAGYEVTLYNDPWEAEASPFQQLPIRAFNPKDGNRDILIVFRSPNPQSVMVNNCLKVWWSCDQQTVGDFKSFSSTVDKIVCISPFHQEYFRNVYGINNTMFIDLPVRLDDFEDIAGQDKGDSEHATDQAQYENKPGETDQPSINFSHESLSRRYPNPRMVVILKECLSSGKRSRRRLMCTSSVRSLP